MKLINSSTIISPDNPIAAPCYIVSLYLLNSLPYSCYHIYNDDIYSAFVSTKYTNIQNIKLEWDYPANDVEFKGEMGQIISSYLNLYKDTSKYINKI